LETKNPVPEAAAIILLLSGSCFLGCCSFGCCSFGSCFLGFSTIFLFSIFSLSASQSKLGSPDLTIYSSISELVMDQFEAGFPFI
jgi:hypothetical protein